MSFTVIEKIKRSAVSLSEKETLSIAQMLNSQTEMANYRIVTSEMFDNDKDFDTFLHTFLCVWAYVASSDGLKVPTYDPFAIGYTKGVDDAIDIWVSWYSNCIIIHFEKKEEVENQAQTLASSFLLMDVETHEQIQNEKNSVSKVFKSDEGMTDVS